ncbi:hypothetical protein ACFWXO_41905 [Kitasatospora sp. NPDC059088]|uniref:hypothetical protein n=1 Tax=Kitasatospora sp. NPDC059088 TaxID=3346722 RepID=UPI0036775620
MSTIVAGQHAASKTEFAELALGIDSELFTGPAGPERTADRTARLAAAADILTVLRREDPELASYADQLMRRAKPRPTAQVAVCHLVLLIGGTGRSGKNVRTAPATGKAAA